MVVVITNITDAAEGGGAPRPTTVQIFNKKLGPGKSIRIDARYVDGKMRKLEESKVISIGKVPPWYQDHKERRSRRKVSAEDIQAQLAASRKKASEKEAARKAMGIGTSPGSPTAPIVTPAPMSFDLSDTVDEPSDDVSMNEDSSGDDDGEKGHKGRKKKRR